MKSGISYQLSEILHPRFEEEIRIHSCNNNEHNHIDCCNKLFTFFQCQDTFYPYYWVIALILSICLGTIFITKLRNGKKARVARFYFYCFLSSLLWITCRLSLTLKPPQLLISILSAMVGYFAGYYLISECYSVMKLFNYRIYVCFSILSVVFFILCCAALICQFITIFSTSLSDMASNIADLFIYAFQISGDFLLSMSIYFAFFYNYHYNRLMDKWYKVLMAVCSLVFVFISLYELLYLIFMRVSHGINEANAVYYYWLRRDNPYKDYKLNGMLAHRMIINFIDIVRTLTLSITVMVIDYYNSQEVSSDFNTLRERLRP